jgi:hypothetical protein
MDCHGNSPTHCCWIGGQVCPHLEEDTVEGRRWACGLYRRYESWDAVYDSPEYAATDAAVSFAVNHPGYGCGDWPQNIPEAAASVSGKCCWQEEVT